LSLVNCLIYIAKLYHPDIRKNDKFSNAQFAKLSENYERLKEYHEFRGKLTDLENNVDDDGSVHLSSLSINPNMDYDSDKKDTIQQICIF
jgi:curved DNA-binding protein CbpA